MPDYSTSIEIEAPADVVFDHLTTAEGMVAWMGQYASLHPEPGGEFSVDISGTPIRGSFLEVDRPRRLVVSWGVAGNDEFPPGSSRVEFTLTPTVDGTRLDLVHSGLPESKAAGYAMGWTHFLARLRIAGPGGDPGPDPYATGWPKTRA